MNDTIQEYNMRNLPVRKCSVYCKDHPEWGTFGIMDDCGDWYNIYNQRGHRILSKTEAEQFWEVYNGQLR